MNKMIRKGMIGAVMLGAAVAISGGVATAGYIQGTHVKTDLPGPFHITMSPDGSTLFISNQSGHSVTFVDARTQKVTGEVAVRVQPEASAVTPDGAFLYVCNAESDSVSVVDIQRKQEIKEIKVGDWPSGIKISPDGKTAYVACSGCMWNAIDVIDTGRMEKVRSIYTSDYGPRMVEISPDGKTLVAILDTVGSINRSVDFIDIASGRVVENRVIHESSNLRDVVYTPDGKYIAVTHQTPKNWLPVCEAENGQVFTNNVTIIETKAGGKVARLPLDDLNNYDGNPYGMAMDPKGKYLYIGVRGMHRVTILDMDKVLGLVRSSTQAELDYLRDDLGLVRDYLVARVPTGLGPSSVCLSPDGKFCYAANYFSNNVTVIRTAVD
ncbi:hydrazine synthase subunit beta [uncultured Candidatus Kuenenia sp.]|uniref:hydrazine synthase subunit beta n=1 Tax=uncultured Candidatus Kuenenia sp. TaxID=1048336 RepID=UPI0025FCB076|nr:hydrazine synthase subunit beta [uncultured Candidatus Kuenenia sp.]